MKGIEYRKATAGARSSILDLPSSFIAFHFLSSTSLFMPRLILASQSRHRLELLRGAGYDVVAVPAEITEPDPAGFADVKAGLIHIAELKVRDAERRGAQGLILGADTVGLVGGRVFGKPVDRADAQRKLQAISGSVHEVLTGWYLLRTRDQSHFAGAETTTITMRPWTRDEFEAYLESGAWIGKSGAYGLALPHDPFVTSMVGSASNVIGVPLEILADAIAALNNKDPTTGK
jgi:septum formation protein